MTILENRVTFSYSDYISMIETLLAEGKTTGDNHSEDYLQYTRMNMQRMRRIYKTAKLLPETETAIAAVSGAYTWLILTEAWCGDAAQNIPVIQRIADLSPQVKVQYILRDTNLDLMDQHLTNGGRGIPKMLVIDDNSGEVAAEWGPRPAHAQKMVMDYKALEDKPPYSEFVKEVQKWYGTDRTISTQSELVALLGNL